jgi:hypothetical protein
VSGGDEGGVARDGQSGATSLTGAAASNAVDSDEARQPDDERAEDELRPQAN